MKRYARRTLVAVAGPAAAGAMFMASPATAADRAARDVVPRSRRSQQITFPLVSEDRWRDLDRGNAAWPG